MAAARQLENLLKIGGLSKASGVPTATIKFYLREGLLPRPTVKTSRNMAYYHPSFVERIRLIKRLQERYLPLRAIKQILAEHERASKAEIETLAALESTLAAVLTVRSRRLTSERTLLRRYPEATHERLALLVELGLVRPVVRSGHIYYGADDVRLLDALHRAHEAGFSPDRFPVEELGHYVELLGELGDREMRFFARNVTGRLSPREARRLAERAMEASEPVVLLIRRKLLRAALDKALLAADRRRER